MNALWVCFCRLYNDFVDSVAIQTQALRETQAVAIADQQKLDEESLQRIKEEDSKAKVLLTHPSRGRGAFLDIRRVPQLQRCLQ